LENFLIGDILPDRIAIKRTQDIACGLLAHAVDRFGAGKSRQQSWQSPHWRG
jgi:hypothetical protein